MEINCGKKFLSDLVKRNPFVFHNLTPGEFQKYLRRELEFKGKDPVFALRCEIRDLHKKHRSSLEKVLLRLNRARIEYEKSHLREQLEHLDWEIDGTRKAISGLSKSLEDSKKTRKILRSEKKEAFEKKLQELMAEKNHLLSQFPEKEAFQEAEEELSHLKDQWGITPLERKLEGLLLAQGHSSSRAGDSFEEKSLKAVEEIILPQLAGRVKGERHILSRVTLGCAKAELDYLVVERKDPGAEVTVLAMVEVKRNINDVSWGFQMRQENLAWFGAFQGRYNPEEYQTKIFRKGHFDRSASHKEKGEEFLFTSSSFSLFSPDSKRDYFVDHLYFITEERSLKGMTSGENSRLLYRISTDQNFDLENFSYIEGLLQWAREAISPFQTRDVLSLYSEKKSWSHQFLVLTK